MDETVTDFLLGSSIRGLVSRVFVLAIVALCVPAVVWPGSMALTAPLLCAQGHDEPVVVETRTQYSDREGINYTLYCLQADGEVQNAGQLLPTIIPAVAVFLPLAGVLVSGHVWRTKRSGAIDGPIGHIAADRSARTDPG